MNNENKQQKPNCPLIGEDGNIFHLVGIAAKTLKRNGMSAEAKVWIVQGADTANGKATRHVVVYDETGAKAASTEDDNQFKKLLKNDPYIATLKVPAAGTYYLGNTEGSNYFFKVEVAEESAGAPIEFKEYVLDTSDDLTEAGKGQLVGDKATQVVTKDGFDFPYFIALLQKSTQAKIPLTTVTKELKE